MTAQAYSTVQDHLTKVVDGEGTVTEYIYSDRDAMTKETSEVSGVTDYTYTPSGQLETKTDARGIIETRSYDALDRTTQVEYPDDSLDITYSYDDPALAFGIGRLAAIIRDSHAVDYAFDRFGRLTQDGELTFVYDRNGNRTGIGYPGGVMASYTFDYADRESTLEVDEGGGAQSIVISASYLPSGPLDDLVLGNGLEEIRPYDSRYYPAEIRVNDGVADLLHWSYTVDSVGNPTAIADVLDSANDRTYAYQDYQYFLTQGNGPWGTRSFTYDSIGNRLSEQKDGGFTDTYSYGPNAAMTGNSPKLEQITVSGGIRTFMYDAAGNQTQVSAGGNVIDRSYDDAGRMGLQERASANASTELLYDGRSFLRTAIGREPAAAGDGVFCDGFESGDISAWGAAGSVCLESVQTGPNYDSSGLLHAVDETLVLYFAGRPVAQFAAVPLFLTTDHLGTPIQATDGAMTVSWEGGFEPFGADYSGAQTAGVFLRFPGQWDTVVWKESAQGNPVHQNTYRWYQLLGRYTSIDPLGKSSSSAELAFRDLYAGSPERQAVDLRLHAPQSQHEYAYAESVPTRETDPTGLIPPGFLATAGVCAVVDGPAPIGDLVALGVLAVGTVVALTMPQTEVEVCRDCPIEFSRQKRWQCVAKCNIDALGEQVTGPPARGTSQAQACRAAKKLVNSLVPPGAYKRHCRCICSNL